MDNSLCFMIHFIIMQTKAGRPFKYPHLPLRIQELLDKGLNNNQIATLLKVGRALIGYHRKKLRLSPTKQKKVV